MHHQKHNPIYFQCFQSDYHKIHRMHQLQEINDRWKGTLIETLGIRLTKSSIVKGEKLEMTSDTPISFEAEMLVTPAVSQPFGILHGGHFYFHHVFNCKCSWRFRFGH